MTREPSEGSIFRFSKPAYLHDRHKKSFITDFSVRRVSVEYNKGAFSLLYYVRKIIYARFIKITKLVASKARRDVVETPRGINKEIFN